MNLKFKIEQIAICPPNPIRAAALLKRMSDADFVNDHVTATGHVYGIEEPNSQADLRFNYSLLEDAREFEILHYTDGKNWMRPRGHHASHFGMHCTAEELNNWRKFFFKENINIAQEVRTTDHTNPAIRGKRLYHYVIFDTKAILGIDVKFIVRRDQS